MITPRGTLTTMSTSLDAPVPIRIPLEITVDTANYAPYFRSLRTSLINALTLGETLAPEDIITEVNFVLVCRYFLKGRINHVNSLATGSRPDGRISSPHAFLMPKSLADLISKVGTFSARQGELMIIPSPEAHPAVAAEQLQVQVTAALLQQFRSLTTQCHARGFIRTARVTELPEGTGYWFTCVHDNDGAIADGNQDAVQVRSIYPDVTPSDIMLAAIVQNQATGLTPNDLAHGWESIHAVGILSNR